MAAAKTKPFRTILDPPVVNFSEAGQEFEEVMAMKIGEHGEQEFYVSGKTNVYEAIQQAAEGHTIEDIIAKVVMTGDTSILNKVQGSYLDLTETPKDIFEAQQKIQEAEADFQKMPLEVRKAYNNNFNEYLADFGSDKWKEVVGITKPDTTPAPEPKGDDE